ncbi:MDIS1-interacting receptor kinase [Salix suchowensis]|nr:MDIS1-interacting receptor kinase [Salix suchowensis]
MACFLACFGSSKERKRRRHSKVQPRVHVMVVHGIYRSVVKDCCPEKPIVSPVSDIRDDGSEEKLSLSTRKKVTFNSNVTTYDHVSVEESTDFTLGKEDGGDKREGKEENSAQPSQSQSSSEDSSIASSLCSYPPPNHRYQNCRDSDDELGCEESDIDESDEEEEEENGGLDHDDVYEDDEIAESRSRMAKLANEENDRDVMVSGLSGNRNFRGRRAAVLNPVENLSQWKIATERESDIDQEPRISFSSEPGFKELAFSFKAKAGQCNKKPDQEVAVDASLSNWLGSSECTPVSKPVSIGLDAIAPEKSMPQGSNSPRSFDDRPILGALTVEELKHRSPDEMPIIGTVGTYWNHSGSGKDSGSASSYKGIPNTTSKYREDKRVNWHSTPFETRLERALNGETPCPLHLLLLLHGLVLTSTTFARGPLFPATSPLEHLNIAGTLARFNFTPFTDLTGFDIQNNNVSGTIPSAIGSLSKLNYLDLKFPAFITNCRNLTFLDLSINDFTGQIPELLYTNLGKLETLSLSDNSFEGPLSPNISKLSNLKNLSLQNNLLSGRIPESIGSMSGLQIHLEKLDLRMNALNSTIPPELGHCTNLTYLILAGNELSGELPLSLSSLSKLTDMGLSENYLTGKITPTLISNWTELTSLQVQNNLFSGNIPPEIGKLTRLQYLFLYNNTFSGSIPPEIGNLKELSNLDLSGNNISGPLPPTLWDLTKLQILNLFLNNINGKIPPQVGNLKVLETLDLNTNQFHGELPQTISNITSLTAISLFGNNFSGSIPSDLGKYMPSLQYASFSNNSFSGELPPELCSGLSLQQFTVNSNSFTGSLPTCLKNCSELTRVRLDENRFTGNITDAFDWGECKNLTNLMMDGNRISGEIPPELGKLPKLQRLSLGSNDLTGRIPAALGNLSMLFKLDLSNNHLTGELTGNIPKELGSYEKLSSLDLSHNNLSGDIPFELGNLNSLQYLLDLSSNSLSGAIPQNLGKLSRFGVVALEVMTGRHPGDLLSSLSSIKPSLSNEPQFFLKDLLDPRLESGLSMHTNQARGAAHHAFCGARIISKNSTFPG